MTDSYREQRPLLCDDYSDEEFDVKNYKYQRRKRPSVCSGRARNYARGAAAVINRWPDHCSTSVAYWWLGVSMIAIIVFVIYNSVVIFGMIPNTDIKEPKYRIFNSEIKPKIQYSSMPEVFMHIIVNNASNVILNKYFPYVRVISKKYPSFKYNFLVLLNDTLKDLPDYKDEERNDVAFNSLWINEKNNRIISIKYNIYVDYISLSTYLNDSPTRKFWRHLPPHIIEFLVRSVPIWEKGGIAFNPKILMPSPYKRPYIDKLYDILDIYVNSSGKAARKKINENLYANVSTRRPNNIQDIINELDKDGNNFSNTDLSVAENHDIEILSHTNNILKFKRDSNYYNSKMWGKNSDTNFNNQYNNKTSASTNSTNGPDNMLPLFIKYLFENKPNNVINESNVLHLKQTKENISLLDSHMNLNQTKPLSAENVLKVTTEHVDNNSSNSNFEESSNKILQIPVDHLSVLKLNKYDNMPELFVDIKGNIIASKIACHAFLGTMFSNVIRHSEETLTDFLISELSLFCNGELTSCAGVNVIFV